MIKNIYNMIIKTNFEKIEKLFNSKNDFFLKYLVVMFLEIFLFQNPKK